MINRVVPVVAVVCALIVGVAGARPAGAAAADTEKGKAAYEKCAACHTVDGTESDGPTLKGVFGRKAGAVDGFRYSAAMMRSDVVWDAMTLDAFLTDPQVSVPRNRMAFAGMPDKADRDDLIAYLEQATKPQE